VLNLSGGKDVRSSLVNSNYAFYKNVKKIGLQSENRDSMAILNKCVLWKLQQFQIHRFHYVKDNERKVCYQKTNVFWNLRSDLEQMTGTFRCHD